MCIPGCDTRSLKGKVVSSHGLSKPHLEIIEAEDNGRASRTAEFRPNCLNGPTSLTSDKAWTSPNAALISLINWSGMFCQKLDPATVEYERQYQEKKVNSCRAHVQNGKCSSHNSHTASKQSNAHPSHQSRLDSIRISWNLSHSLAICDQPVTNADRGALLPRLLANICGVQFAKQRHRSRRPL